MGLQGRAIGYRGYAIGLLGYRAIGRYRAILL